ncbi:MAG: glycosyltransferase family 4 protein [Candidatus Hodarchaeota archaeon]
MKHKNIKICHITRDVNPNYSIWFGGVPSWIKLICEELEKRNYIFSYITPKAKITKSKTKAHIYRFKMGISKLLSRIASFFFIFRNVKKHKVDLIHLHLLSTLSELEIFLLKKIFKIPIIATCYSDIRTSKILNLYYKIFRKTFLDKIITINTNLMRILKKYGISKKKLVKIPVVPDRKFYSLDDSNSINIRKINLEKNKTYILFSAGSRREMGIFYIIREFVNLIKENKREYENIKFIITHVSKKSDDRIIKRLKSFLDRKKLGNFFLFFDHIENMREFLSQIDILVVPIIEFKHKMNSPKMILEAMLLKKIVIASPYGGISEIIRSYENGILIKPQKNNFKDAIKFILKNKDLTEKLGKQAYKTIIENFEIEEIMNKLDELYKNIVVKSK